MNFRFNKTERIGVNLVEKIILSDFSWIFRDQPISDMGIDAQIERVENGIPTAEILGLQIKTGKSHFKVGKNGLTYYGSKTHYKYWINSSIPVLLIACLPEENKIYWNVINIFTIKVTNKGFKILIPYVNVFNKDATDDIVDIMKGPKELQRIRKLFYDIELIKYLKNNGKIVIETEDWFNKSLGRGDIKVILIDENEKERVERKWYSYYLFPSVYENVKDYFPWANITVDEYFYDMNFDDHVYSIYPEIYIKEHMKVYPYDIASSEIAYYRLELSLNDVGKSFLVISDYLANE